MSSPVATETFLEALTAALGWAARYNRSALVAPAAVLWPDETRQWEPLVPLLRELLPAFLTLGEYAPEERIGPAIWMRCLLAGELEAAEWSEGGLGAALGELTELAPHEAEARIAELEQQHGVRREWVWAELGQAPLARALEYLATSPG